MDSSSHLWSTQSHMCRCKTASQPHTLTDHAPQFILQKLGSYVHTIHKSYADTRLNRCMCQFASAHHVCDYRGTGCHLHPGIMHALQIVLQASCLVWFAVCHVSACIVIPSFHNQPSLYKSTCPCLYNTKVANETRAFSL